jgi:ATP-dependent Lon protease
MNTAKDQAHVETPDHENRSEAITNKDNSALPILPVRGLVAFPRMRVPFVVSLNADPVVDAAMQSDEMVGLLTVRSEDTEDPTPADLYAVGTIAKILQAKKNDEGLLVVLLEGQSRFRVADWEIGDAMLRARAILAPEVVENDMEIEVLQGHLVRLVTEIMKLRSEGGGGLAKAVAQIEDPLQLVYVTAFNSSMAVAARQALLETDSTSQKIRDLLTHLSREKEKLTIGKKIQSDIKDTMDKSQREYYLRQQLAAIKKELGEAEAEESEADRYAEKIAAADLSEEARQEATRELERMRHMSPQSAEYPIIKTYLDWIIDLPWATLSEENADVVAARAILDADHYGLREVKERLTEFIAVRSLIHSRVPEADRQEDGAPGVILCLAGPPGVGKTSLGQSVARALGREFTRMSLGGVRDESEIRGHRRTYVGAMPGRIIQAIKRAGTRNPVFMLDEIDKIGQDWRGDPSSALLEVLDPAQNHAFRDHYLDVDFDLSEVIFIATANQLDTIPDPLRDRMEIIQLDGYTELEKLEIAKRHLIPRQLKAHGLLEEEVTFMDEAIGKIVQGYTREAGVRNLERHIAAICRKGIVRLSESGWSHVVITAKMVREYLKRERFETERLENRRIPGIATGLAVTAVGGDILHIEATRMPGKGRIALTGQLGEVMKESAEIALSYLRSQAIHLGIDPADFDKSDVHLHVPAGALPKDGPSAGVAMVMALASRFSNQPLPAEVGITGEITLRGRILPVGGVKMKVLAAHRAGLKTVYLPARNQADLDELPPEVAEAMNLVPVDHMDAVFERLLMGAQGRSPSSDDDAMIPLPDPSEGRLREKAMVPCN